MRALKSLFQEGIHVAVLATIRSSYTCTTAPSKTPSADRHSVGCCLRCPVHSFGHGHRHQECLRRQVRRSVRRQPQGLLQVLLREHRHRREVRRCACTGYAVLRVRKAHLPFVRLPTGSPAGSSFYARSEINRYLWCGIVG